MRLLKSVRGLCSEAASALGAGKDPETQKAELEKLLTAALPFAKHMLAQHGEFFPYGATMDRKGEISNVGGFTGEEQPKPAELIDLLKEAFRRDAKARKIMACALFYDVLRAEPGQAQKTGAVGIALDHRDGVSLVMVYPYSIGPDKKVTLAAPLATKGKGEIFKARKTAVG